MNAEQLQIKLKELDACQGAQNWAEGKDLKTAWGTCERGDWMMWLIYNGKYDISHNTLRLLAVRFAREVQHLMEDRRSIIALDVAERFANGEATEEELDAARAASRAAVWAAADAAAAAADAADAAMDAARDASRAASMDAAWAAADASWAAAWASARGAASKKQANIIREFIPELN